MMLSQKNTSPPILTDRALLAWENRLVKRFCWFFGIFHIVFLVFDFALFKSDITLDDWEMGVELVDENLSKSDVESIRDSTPGNVLSVDDQALPLLPKKFEIETPPEETAEEEAIAAAEEKAEEEAKKRAAEETAKETEAKRLAEESAVAKKAEEEKKAEEVKKAAEARLVEETKRIKDKAIAQLTKDDAIKRLLREKAKLENRGAKENKSPLNENLTKRLAELEKNDGSPAGLLTQSTYGQSVKRRIAKFYALPEIYNLREAPIKAVIQMVLDAKGELVEAKLSESSHDDAFDQLALKTIRDASPFPAPPADWVGKIITVPFEPVKR